MTPTSSRSDSVAVAASLLRQAQETGVPCAPIRHLVDESDESSAYAVAQENVEALLRAGRIRIGRKIGLTSAAVQQQLGVDRPDYGSLLDDMQVEASGTIRSGRLLQPKVEAEVAFILATDIDGEWDRPEDLITAVDGVASALEIVDSRIAGWDIRFVDTVADNASCGMFVLSERVLPLPEVQLADIEMSLRLNGELRSQGTGQACLGSPLIALDWLARTAVRLGDPLRAGEIVLSGALGPMVTASPGDHVEAILSQLGPVSVAFDGVTGVR